MEFVRRSGLFVHEMACGDSGFQLHRSDKLALGVFFLNDATAKTTQTPSVLIVQCILDCFEVVSGERQLNVDALIAV